MAQSMAVEVTKLLLFEDLISLYQLLNTVKEKEADVSYCFVTDSRNKVIAHTFGSSFPLELIGANEIKKGEAYHFQYIKDEKGQHYRDVMVPILEGKLGFLRLGITEKSLSATTNKIVVFLTSIVLIFLMLGIAGALIFSYWITNPISKITNAFETINLDQKFNPVKINTRDEINVLANKFNEMACRLQRTHADLKKAQQSHTQTEKLASMGTLASGLTHEISSPLAGLKNCLIRIEKEPSKQIRRYFSLMMAAIQKIEKVVQGLLDFSRRDDYHFKQINLHTTIERALSLVEYKFEKKGIEVVKNYAQNGRPCRGDSQHIEQVIINLVLNAVDAMPQGGRLTVSTHFKNSRAWVEIEDTGTGISSENIDKIFDPFFTTKEPGKGTGLGLSVSYNIIRDHGGDITVESKINSGTKFTINIPLYGEENEHSSR